MKRRAVLGLLPAAALLQAADDAGRGEIAALIRKYAASVNAADPNLAAEVWSDSPDVSFIHPLGWEHGLAQIKQNVYGRIMGGMFTERKLEPRDPTIHVYGPTAWSEFAWNFTAKRAGTGAEVHTAGRETQIYRKEPAGWRIVHVHYSAPMDRPPAS
jgi:ketosteroid isomerase-like protein